MKPDRRRNKPLPVYSREEQRKIVINSVHYLSGEEFNRSDIAPLVALESENTAFLLSSMASDGLLRRRFVKQGNKQFICYSKPLSPILSKRWRQNTNGQLNLVETNLLGQCGR